MGRPPLKIEVAPKDQKELAKLLSGGVQQVRVVLRALVLLPTRELADQVARIVRSLRTLELKKHPSVSETLDWARTLVVLGIESIDAEQAKVAEKNAAKQSEQNNKAASSGGTASSKTKSENRYLDTLV